MIDLRGLPKELLKELSCEKQSTIQKQIIDVIKNKYDGFANIDEILVGLYHKYNLILKRQYITNVLYRMANKGLLISVKGKKGIYKTRDLKFLDTAEQEV